MQEYLEEEEIGKITYEGVEETINRLKLRRISGEDVIVQGGYWIYEEKREKNTK